MNPRLHIYGLGLYVPDRVMTNAEFERTIETSDEWITSRTGIRERHYAAPDQACSDLAAHAARQALDDAGLAASDLSHILVATLSPDAIVPAACYTVQEKLGIKGRMAVDFSAACSGYIYGLELARALVALHPEAKVLLAASEVLTSRTNWDDRSTCILFGDGAGAIVLGGPPVPGGPRPLAEVMDVIAASDGSLGDLLTIKGGGSAHPLKLGEPVGPDCFVQMQGREVFKHAVRNMEAVSREILARNGLTTDDLDLVIPHQANNRIIEAVGERLSVPKDKVFSNVARYGNTSAASIGIALAEARSMGLIKPGARVLLTAFGGGFTWAAALLRFLP
jgi:3-oxoacyl-[acyl-carrier-protein] synthase-3